MLLIHLHEYCRVFCFYFLDLKFLILLLLKTFLNLVGLCNCVVNCFFSTLKRGFSYCSCVSLWNQNSCQMADLSNLLNSTNVWVISSLRGSIVNLSPRFSRLTIGLVNTILDSLNMTLISCLFSALIEVLTED